MTEAPRPLYAGPPQGSYGGTVQLYAVTIHSAIAQNDLDGLNSLICQAEHYLETYGDLPTLIEHLKTEIARLER